MDRIFRIDFYPADWLVKTGGLTPEECGFYIQIISLIYCHRGPIENDPAEISRKLKGCSSRLAKSIIQKLSDKGKITIQDGFISNSRAENELNKKRTHLESSANGGRTKAENQLRIKENNSLASSDPHFSLATSSPSPPLSNKLPIPVTDPARENGVLKKSGGRQGDKKFSIESFLTDAQREHARKVAPGWDLYPLFQIYDEGINSGQRDPPVHPGKAFIGWLPKYTKGKIL